MLSKRFYLYTRMICEYVPSRASSAFKYICFKMQRRLLHHQLRVTNMFPPFSQQITQSKRIVLDEHGCRSQNLMLSNKLLVGGSAGTFFLLPHTLRATEKLCRLLDQEMQAMGAQKISMPLLAPEHLWKSSQRWDEMGSELFTLKDRKNASHCLSPTHEEAVTFLVSTLASPVSHKRLPIKLYQIGKKFRDEMRPKNGLLRSREFEMKDLYTFDKDQESAEKTYNEVCATYERLLNRLELVHLKVEASARAMGGVKSQEFQLPSPQGEDTVFQCERCGRTMNKEVVDAPPEDKYTCDVQGCSGEFTELSGIEIAHAFILGTRYSEIFQATCTDESQQKRPLFMGCYGVGVTRLLAAAIEVLSSHDQIRWPRLVAPYQICVIPQKEGYKADVTLDLADRLCMTLTSLPGLAGEVVLDDRLKLSIGRRLTQAKQMGFPHTIVIGKKAIGDSPSFEYTDVYDGTTSFVTEEKLLSMLTHIETVPL